MSPQGHPRALSSPVDGLTRRSLIAGGLTALAGVAVLTACGPSGNSTNPGAGEASKPGRAGHSPGASGLPAPEQKTAYPLDLVTPHGTTTLRSRPERVAVVAGLQDLEALMALQGIPVISDMIAWPWQTVVLGDRKVEQFDIWSEAGLPFEKILAAKPDVILAASFADLDQNYAKLAKIAPVVALKDVKASDTWKADWRDILRTVATALDLSDAAERKIAETDAAVDKVALAHPGWKDKSLSFVMNRGQAAGLTVTNVHGTPVEAMARRLGFAPQPHAQELVASEGDVSPERVGLIDADLLMIAQHGGSGSSAEAKEWLESNQLYQQLGAVKDKRVVFVERDEKGELPMAWAFDYPNALSTPWLLERFSALVTPVLP